MIKNKYLKFITFLVGLNIVIIHTYSISEEKKPLSPQNEEKIITDLIKTIAESNLKFIRNGSTYTAQEAASHLQLKLEIANKKKFKSKITVCEFINNVAAKSSLSGLPYQIEIEAGKKILLQTWLMDNLKKQDATFAKRCKENSGN